MSAEQTPDIEAVLAEHEYLLQYRSGGICTCGFVPTVDAGSLKTQQDYHRAHVADRLAAAVREAEQRVASAFVEWAMKNESAEPPLDWAWFGEITRRYWPHHPEYRADRIAVDAPEGGA